MNAERVHVGYLEAFVLSSVGREYFQTSARGTSGSMVKINRDIIERFEILLPPLAEQRKIAAILSSVDEAIEKTLAVIDKVQVVKKGLMQELLTKGLPGRHKTFKQTEIGRIPGEWSTAELSDIGNGQDPVLRTGPFGSSLKTEHFRPSGVPVLTIQSLGEGEISDEGLFFVNDAKAKELRDYRVRQGDLVFSRVADIGRSVVIPERADGWIISSNLMRISPDRSRIDSRFLMYLLVGSPRVVRQIEQLSGGEGRKVISSPVLKKLLFPMPAIDEQVTIADTLGSLEGRIREERRHREGLLSLKSALQSLLLTGEIRVRPTPAPEPAP
ncbi:restriction endonuclease subunit S [Paraliomyxa miuraensis]|nr:restriction endonuclease subunit S [Paraliomyxa miuraensis]